jgi:hypothetical protein
MRKWAVDLLHLGDFLAILHAQGGLFRQQPRQRGSDAIALLSVGQVGCLEQRIAIARLDRGLTAEDAGTVPVGSRNRRFRENRSYQRIWGGMSDRTLCPPVGLTEKWDPIDLKAKLFGWAFCHELAAADVPAHCLKIPMARMAHDGFVGYAFTIK